MASRLERAVQTWVRAEYQFRASPIAYSHGTQEWFEKACTKLRRALTGKGDLEKAFNEIGGPVAGRRKKKHKQR